MKAFITKYALTEGIIEVEYTHIFNDGSITFEGEYCTVSEWQSSKDDAIKKAEEMREKKIKSLKKQLDKLANLTFKL